jgi:phytoene dehydrogenase-like protein
MSEKSILIAGAGMAGLSAGCYARMNGYKATILEMHNIPGGLCTAWKRKGYTFDISMHLLTGSVGGPFHQLWQELGVMENRRFHYHDEMYRVEGRERSISICTDIDRLEQQLTAASPADAELVRELAKLLAGPGVMNAASLKAPELFTLLDGIRMGLAVLPLIAAFRKYGKTTLQEFASRFSDPFLGRAVRMIVDVPGWPMPNYPMAALAGILRSTVTEAGVPLGGSQQVAFGIAERFKKLGGELRLKTKVTGLEVENDRVRGVKVGDGEVLRADEIIWAADGHTLIFGLLGGRYVDERIRTMYEKWVPVQPLVHVCLGVARDMTGEPARLAIELADPLTVAGEKRDWLSVIHHSFDPAMAPAGKSAVEAWFPSKAEYWEELAKDRPRYEVEKQQIAEQTIAALEKRWPGFSGQVEVVDVATPHTYVRYTGNWQGSPDGWYITSDNMRSNPVHTLPGLSGLWTAGQWTAPYTGTVIAALSGRQVVQLLCRQDRRRFVATQPNASH